MDKKSIIIFIVAWIFGIAAVILYTVFGYSNKLLTFTADTLLMLAFIMVMWLKFYSTIEPVWVGITFAVILFLAFYIVSMIIKHLNITSNYLMSIPVMLLLAWVLNRNQDKIIKFLVGLFSK